VKIAIDSPYFWTLKILNLFIKMKTYPGPTIEKMKENVIEYFDDKDSAKQRFSELMLEFFLSHTHQEPFSMVEIDEDVFRLCQKYLPQTAKNVEELISDAPDKYKMRQLLRIYYKGTDQ
jgi:L-2-hydroxyglutarate oxidase LhgO